MELSSWFEPFEAVSCNTSMVLYPFLPWPVTTRQGKLSSNPAFVRRDVVTLGPHLNTVKPFRMFTCKLRLQFYLYAERTRISLNIGRMIVTSAPAEATDRPHLNHRAM